MGVLAQLLVSVIDGSSIEFGAVKVGGLAAVILVAAAIWFSVRM